MPPAEFDEHAANYKRIHAQNISASGEEPEYFAAYKMRDFSELVIKHGAPQDGSYLDFGSGIGASVRPFQHVLPQAHLICADVSAVSLEKSRELNGSKPEYLLVEDPKIPLPNGGLDGAFACCVFHHIPPTQHGTTLRELRRVLKPKAPLMIYEHNGNNPLTVRAVNTCPLDENAILIGARELQRLCISLGFSSVTINYRVFFPAALKFLRPAENHLRWLPLGAQYFVCALA